MHMSNRSLSNYFDNFFDEFRPITSQVGRWVSTSPALNIKEFKDRYEISLAVPGIDTSKIKVELNEQILTISYTHEEEQEKEETDYLRYEYKASSFSRSVALPKHVDTDSIKAGSAKGVLTVIVNKSPESQPKTIEIKVDNS